VSAPKVRVATPASLSVTPLSLGVGSVTATCSGAVDKAGNEAAAVSVTYVVTHGLSAFDRPISDPAGSNPTAVKKGSTLPVKISLLEADGVTPISSAQGPGPRGRLCAPAQLGEGG
jgi:hypothetical protein